MSEHPEEPEVGRRHYAVTEVSGHQPDGLDDFVGATTVTVENEGQRHRLIGAGERVDQTVMFQQKEPDSALDTGPLWHIHVDGGGGIVAERN